MKIDKLLRGFYLILKLNLIKTLFLNFKLLPLRDAICLPILLFGKISISECTGNIELLKVKFGTLRVGYFPHRLFGLDYCNSLTRLSIKGKMIVGENVFIGNGSFIKVEEKGILSLGNDVKIGPNTRMYSKRNITIGGTCYISWDCQFFDTDFHYVVDEQGRVFRNDKSIIIGYNVWIGNRVTINKGSKIADYSIIASNSLVNKNLSDIYGSGVFAGIPAKLMGTGKKRIFNYNVETKMDRLFNNPEIEFIVDSEVKSLVT